MKHRNSRNPLDGIAPADQSAMSQGHTEVPEEEFDWGSADWELMHRVTRMICDKYGLRKGDIKLAKHDREARKLYLLIKRGEPIPDHYTRRYVVTAPTAEELQTRAALNPLNWGNPPIG